MVTESSTVTLASRAGVVSGSMSESTVKLVSGEPANSLLDNADWGSDSPISPSRSRSCQARSSNGVSGT